MGEVQAQSAASLAAPAAGTPRRRNAYAWIAAALVAIAVIRVVATWHVFNHTYDEGAKMAVGLSFLTTGRFDPRMQHPPAGVVPLALGPWLRGARYSANAPGYYEEGNRVLYGGESYFTELSFLRAAVLPFLLLAAFVTWTWSSRLFGRRTALLAVLVLTTTPEILAHAGLATNDLSGAATFALASIAWFKWLEEPSAATGLWMGAALSLALMVRFSFLAMFPFAIAACALAGLLVRSKPELRLRRRITSLALGVAVAALIVVASYGFTWSTAARLAAEHKNSVAAPVLSSVAQVMPWLPVPAPEFLSDLVSISAVSEERSAFLLGRYSSRGWWYYFPVALLFKTPLPLLILSVIGSGFVARAAWRERRWALATPLASAAGILFSLFLFKVDIGVRYALPISIPVAILAAYGVARMADGAKLLRATAAALLLAQIAVTALAHPDYLAYFNELAGRDPSRILTDSNLDWGQDLVRLETDLRRRGVPSYSLAYFGTADPARHGFAPARRLPPFTFARGWVAVSETSFNGVYTNPLAYAWLRGLAPVGRAGKSIRVYYVPPNYQPAAPVPGTDPRTPRYGWW